MCSPSGNEWDCAFNPDGYGLLSVGEDGVLRMWDIARGVVRWSTAARAEAIRCCTFSPSGTPMATASSDGTVVCCESTRGRW